MKLLDRLIIATNPTIERMGYSEHNDHANRLLVSRYKTAGSAILTGALSGMSLYMLQSSNVNNPTAFAIYGITILSL